MTNTPDRRFRRPVRQCLNCRRKKQKCDRRLPCNNCIRGGRQDSCEYAAGQEPTPAGASDQPSSPKRQRMDRAWSSDTESDIQVNSSGFKELQSRVSLLEEAAQIQNEQIRVLLRSSSSAIRQTSGVADSHEAQRYGQKRTREFTLYKPLPEQFPDLRSFIEQLNEDEPLEELVTLAYNLRNLDSTFGQPQRHHHTFYIHSTVSEVLAHIEMLVPTESTCQVLIDLYFDAFENSLRVLHADTKDEFNAFFRGRLSPGSRAACLPKLLAVLSIASSLGTSPECDKSNLCDQHDGVGAYHLLRNYLALLTEDQWKELPNLQVAVLTLKFHRSATSDPVQQWQWSGEIVRRAMAAGLNHLAPISVDIFAGEMKRKLWLTILELDLTSAIACNMPVSCPTWDYEAPLNINDSEVHPSTKFHPLSKDLEQWTGGICQHILAQSFNYRRDAYALISSDKPAAYSTILRYTRHLEQIIHDLPKVFNLSPTNDPESDSPYRLMAKMELDFLLRRPLNACYAIYGAEFSQSDEFREARIPWMQSACYGICFQDLFDPNFPTVDLPSPEGLWDFYYNVYAWDVDKFLLASCLELQRLRSLDKDAVDHASRPFQGHTARETIRIMGWTVESITASLDQTIDPMVRRLGRHGSSFREVVRWTAVIGALRVEPTCARLDALKKELQDLVINLNRRKGRGIATRQHSQHASVQNETVNDISDLEWLRMVLLNRVHKDTKIG